MNCAQDDDGVRFSDQGSLQGKDRAFDETCSKRCIDKVAVTPNKEEHSNTHHITGSLDIPVKMHMTGSVANSPDEKHEEKPRSYFSLRFARQNDKGTPDVLRQTQRSSRTIQKKPALKGRETRHMPGYCRVMIGLHEQSSICSSPTLFSRPSGERTTGPQMESVKSKPFLFDRKKFEATGTSKTTAHESTLENVQKPTEIGNTEIPISTESHCKDISGTTAVRSTKPSIRKTSVLSSRKCTYASMMDLALRAWPVEKYAHLHNSKLRKTLQKYDVVYWPLIPVGYVRRVSALFEREIANALVKSASLTTPSSHR
ncbi:unnamed protein product [Soboliphyme baturini]|uniref:Uncharacterized protein n=1 Tax=Soboliphyme baturini TaxID=241478 RepID=A0A183IEV8_9BILA|nr:unnamed protein product [Soboliphyme baturini]